MEVESNPDVDSPNRENVVPPPPARRRQNSFPPMPAGIPLDYNLFNAGFDAAWELDVFGGKRRTVEAATCSSDVNEPFDCLNAP